MNKKTLSLIGIAALAIIAIVLMFLSSGAETPIQEEVITEETNQEGEVSFVGGSETDLTVISYGGARDIKTLDVSGEEYALLRNPKATGNLDLAVVDPYGNYYFAETDNGERIVFEEGTPEGKHGYEETGLVSNLLIRERNTFTEYFVAYPDSLSAQVEGLISVPDTGVANRFLKTRYLLIKNLNSNRSVIAEIDHRSNESGTLFVSEATRNALGLDNGTQGSLRIELVPAAPSTLGVVRF
jgi:hypothetical protein